MPSEIKKRKPNRIYLIDELRGLAVIAMVLYHTIYSMTFIFNLEFSYPIMRAILPYQPIIPIVFITLCGISCSFSHSNLKRGLILFSISIAVTLVTALILPSEIIIFGILHFLSAALILYAILQKAINKVPVTLGIIISLILFSIAYNIPKGYIGLEPFACFRLPQWLYSFYPLFIVGLPSNDFYSADYFPIIPYIFLFLFGTFLGKLITTRDFPKWMSKKICPPLDFIGKHALVIYILHQPVIIGILYVVTTIITM